MLGAARPPTPHRWPYVAGAIACIPIVVALHEAARWPDVRGLGSQNPRSTAFIDRYREQERLFGRSDRVAWHWVPDDSLSPHLKRAVIVSEDIGFFSHRGFDIAELRIAFWSALRSGLTPRGASTITQQLAKNLWLSPSRTPLRKLKEALLTRQLEKHLSKRRILELYLNVVELGPGIYGAEAAAEHYFGKTAAALDEREAALLAASLPRPAIWNPASDSRFYLEQVARIEDRMGRATFLWQ